MDGRGVMFHLADERRLDRDVTAAEDFAEDRAQKYRGGTFVLKTLAPAEAIICAPALLRDVSDRFAWEREFLVDRRKRA